jgi:hypothetical protein
MVALLAAGAAPRAGQALGERVTGALCVGAHAGYKLEGRALELVFRRFDPSRAGALSLPEFLALTLFLRSATATFNAFDNTRTGVIQLNFNQFLYAAANTI